MKLGYEGLGKRLGRWVNFSMRGIWDPWRGAARFGQQRRAARARWFSSRKKKKRGAAGRKAAKDHAAQLEGDQTALDEELTAL